MSTRPVSKDMLVLFCYVKKLQFCLCCCHRCEVCMCYHLPSFLISHTSECYFMFVVLLLTHLLPSPSKFTRSLIQLMGRILYVSFVATLCIWVFSSWRVFFCLSQSFYSPCGFPLVCVGDPQT